MKKCSIPNERSHLLSSPSVNRRQPTRRRRFWRELYSKYIVAFAVATLVVNCEYKTLEQDPLGQRKFFGRRAEQEAFHSFPEDFIWGSGTSSHQIEGAADKRGESIWDVFCLDEKNILDGSSGLIACDHYHTMEQDVKLMMDMGLQAYRFSISWPRMLPKGTMKLINLEGIDFYNRLIDALLDAGIEPYVTLYHWDLPQALQNEYEGWQSRHIIDDFGNYARLCFEHFGDRVKHWITINDSWSVAVAGYNNHVMAPGHWKNPDTETYLVAHHLLLAHANTVHIYRNDFQLKQDGMIGIANNGDYRYPLNEETDTEAAQRAMVFQLGWFADPIWFGDYPKEMKERLGSRLPRFTRRERSLLKGSSDFFGLNHHSSLLASEPVTVPEYKGYWADISVEFSTRDRWRRDAMGWSIVPDGCRELLLWISERYNDPMIVITGNGVASAEIDEETAIDDVSRRLYLKHYLVAIAEAIEIGVNVQGYFVWSLMDSFEWQFGYQRRVGLHYVDFETLERTPKDSALWYRQVIKANGGNIHRYYYATLSQD
eukprot:CAMPEP_0194223364 /NCGR_PEP_ID=MMETSP0156-20130528/34980_1 /TAXON_ID=33649 /ORGANISM="Thalassionema nitzschioides, Strain L26-B" /LENGTH=541 /DNA_ID=CAMNT_0038954475 /DNA_START=27 /DNA_END=1652 /DNA_ORIENTATION=-